MNELPVQEATVPYEIMMPFFSRIFALYPDARLIQEKMHEDEKRLTCTITLEKEITESEIVKRSQKILEIIQGTILPHLPAGYTCTARDICFISQDTEGRAEQVCQNICDKFSQEEITVSFMIDPGNGNFEFTVEWSFHSAVQGKIRQEIMKGLPDEFIDRCSIHTIYFQRAVPRTQQTTFARVRSLLGI